MRVAVFAHALVLEAHHARWRRLAERHGAEVTLVVPAAWETTWFGQPRTIRPRPRAEERFRVMPLPVWNRRHWGRYGFLSLDAGLRRTRPAIIAAYGEETSLLLQQMVLLRRLWAPAARLAFFSWNNLGLFQGRHRWLKRRLWGRVCRATDLALAGSAETARLFVEANYPHPIVVQTELGVDEDCFCPDPAQGLDARQALGLSGFVVGYAGRLTAAKGVEDLFAAAAALPADCGLLVVGDGDLRPTLERQARESAFPVHFAGEVPVEQMPRWLRAMDCLVLPSRTTPTWKEQFGLVLAQAMACGVPVVGSASGAIPEVIGDAGLLVPEGSPAALASALTSLLTSPELRSRLAERGRARVLNRYSATALADETFRLFSDLLRQPPRPGHEG
jgi:glycosyltransferase involved in cell wall biosynthesis